MCTSPNYMVWLGEYYPDTHKEKFHFQPHCNYDKILKSNIPFIQVPCGECLECHQERASNWSDRCVFEAMAHEHNYFITLTYDDIHIPLDGCLHAKDMTDFLKRLRFKFKKKFHQENIRFYYCGEYGGESMRCHFHLILFDCKIPDLSDTFELLEKDGRYHKHKRPSSTAQYSRIIYDLWQHKGMITVDEFNYNTAAYVAGYVNKKCDPVHEKRIKALGLTPEFQRMSRNPAIGSCAFDPNMFDKPFISIPRSGGVKHSVIPRIYEKKLDQEYPWLFNDLKNKQAEKRRLNILDYFSSDRFKDIDNEVRNHKNEAKSSVRKKI